MKIALVISTFPPKVGGMGQVALSQARGLARLGYDITIFTLDYGVRFSEEGLKIVYLKPLLRLGDAGLVPQLIFKLVGFDLVHLHFPFYGGAFFVLLSSILNRTPFVSTYHMDSQPSGWFKKIVKYFSDLLVGSLILKKSKKVIVVDKSNGQFSLLSKIYPQNLVYINNSVDIKVFLPLTVSTIDLGLKDLSNKNILLFVGNLLEVKRLDLILQAMHILNDKNLVLLVVGGGYEEKKYRQMVMDMSLQDEVIFVGKVKDPGTLAKYYSLADVTIVPSDYESFSLVTIESMACGTPVIGSKISALENKIEIGKNGLLFQVGNADDLAQKIKDFFNLKSDQRKQLENNSVELVSSNFDSSKNLKELIQLYQSIL